jgi:eukaryotic-like serine/threonine-protein kinase
MVDSGTVIDDRYEVLSRIGTGGMGDVYLARDRLLGRKVALKLLHHRFAEDQEFVERFRREASSAASLSHPNVVSIFDRGEWDGTYYIAMEYLPGRTLKAVVREDGPLDSAAAIDVVIQILQAARFAHRRGVIHRDIKPHNVILDEEGRAKVTDFGIARAGASDMTLTGSIMGTAQYLSPEQAQGHAVSAASDIYAVGIVLYELLTGAVPFDGETAVTIALKQISAVPPPPSARGAVAASAAAEDRPAGGAGAAPRPRPPIPPALDAIVLRALAKDPAERFADADEFIAALEYVRRTLPSAGPRAAAAAPFGNGPAGPATAHTAVHATPLLPPAVRAGPDGYSAAAAYSAAEETAAVRYAAEGEDPQGDARRRRRRRAWIAGALLLALAAGAVAWLLLSAGSNTTVPFVTGRPLAAAEQALRARGLVPVSSEAPSTTVASGLVVSQDRRAGTALRRGSPVSLVVSAGPPSATVPAVVGLARAAAFTKLLAAGFKPTAQSRSSTTAPSGTVLGTEPPAGRRARAGSAVTVFVSEGPPRVTVPEVVGLAEAEARASLVAEGLHVGTVTRREAAGATEGAVLSQSPAAGGLLRTGGTVDLVVAKAPRTATVPSVVGKKQERAEGELIGAGFAVKSVTRAVPVEAEVGLVLEESPPGGTKAKRGTTITLTVGVLAAPTTTTTTPPPTTTAAPPTVGPAGP